MIPLTPYGSRPSVILRRRRRALIRAATSGPLVFRFVAMAVLARRYGKQVLGKHPEYLTTEKVLIGQAMTVSSLQRLTRRDRRRAKAAGTSS